MARKPQTIRITPKLIEFEDYIIRVPNIASVGIGPDPNLRYWALLLFAIAFFLFAGAIAAWQLASYMAQMQAGFGRRGGGGGGEFIGPVLMFLVSGGALAWGIYLWRRKALFISKADSRFTLIVDKNPQFMRDVMARIREALLAGEGGNVYYQVNVQAERIERLDANSTVVANSPGAAVVGGSMINGSMEAHAGLNGGGGMSGGAGDILANALAKARETAAPIVQRTAAAVRSAGGMAQERLAAFTQQAPRGDAQGGAFGPYGNTVTVSQAPGAVVVGGSQIGSQVSTNVSIVNDFDAVMGVLMRERVAHGQEIIEFLRPVRDHLAGGSTPREDARQRWAWFAGQAAAALTGIDGVIGVIERVSRLLGITR